jgi:nitrite reductase/ring-hydroxylating ferredoxin subunit/uncharacterized membrane protein
VDPRNLGERIESMAPLDRVVEPAHRVVTGVLPQGPVKDALHGVWLGHPLHPLLTDLPIGFWTSAWVLDIIGGRKSQPAADALVAYGVVSALPTAAAGLADWSELNKPERRSGLVHAVANIGATALYAWSYVARRRGQRARGVALGMAGAAAATVGGFLGGHLSFRRAAGVNAAADAPAIDDWTEVDLDAALSSEKPVLAHVDGAPLAAIDSPAGPAALFARCSHVGGPLNDGDLVDGCIRCPWHGSMFRADDGSVVRGPATATQPAYQLRRDGQRVLSRRRPPP